MREYELMFIVAQRDVKEGLHEQVVEQIRKLVDALEGRVLRVRPWGLRQLAYEIKGHDYGYYVIMQLLMKPESVSALETKIREIELVIRFLITYQGERGEQEVPAVLSNMVDETELAAATKSAAPEKYAAKQASSESEAPDVNSE